jgi:4-hydroxy-2-oxoheptanedioate aldolase
MTRIREPKGDPMTENATPQNQALQCMRDGQPAIGAGASLGSPLAAEMLAVAGFDFVMVDTQHGAWDDPSIMAAFRGIRLGGSVPMIRVATNDYMLIGRALDQGALGIVVPMVNSRTEAQSAARAVRYPPQGGRSRGPFGAAIYGEDYCSWIDDQVFLAVQIETARAVAHAESILSVDGVDGCWIGPADLAASLGVDPDTESGREARDRAIAQVLRACQRTGKIPGIACGNDASERLEQGFLYVRAGRDDTYMAESANDWLAKNREA